MQKSLESCRISRYLRSGDSKLKLNTNLLREMTIWQFMQNNIPGGVFEIHKLDTTQTARRYIQLRQVSVRVGGRNEKLLIVKDESQRVYLEYLMETKEQMQSFTDAMV